ncbi:cation diffusion facilitator family transporter [Chloroherpeton thalassium ATCC 35110]|uniref:Cation diffusion facilitator family transporter n=1 Tax=Chloroherpeton thalassium (strain ATCC 35110 / GB-78) TaxID=517418 RepID=B3QSK1_CHLT3|nr:cation diffusion facilitator family transporter [Chloroherpeton thalassium]ACF14048.1 cation diffusion facilitator family transporter [Chloroherpeton thalassium ATCC 35110]
MSSHHHDSHEHHHHHHHHHHHEHLTGKNLKWAFALNFAFTIIEFVGGLLTNSMAILSDAVHDLGDSLAIGLSLFFERYAQKKSDTRYTYGYKRFALVSALLNSMILLTGSLFVIYETVPRLFSPEKVQAEGMVWLAVFGVLVNGAAVLRLKGGHSANEKVVMLHLLEDVLGWFAVLIGSLVMLFFDVPIIDPMLSIAISLFILWNVFKNLESFVSTFLQGVPESVDLNEVLLKIQSLQDVISVHDLHAWSIDGTENVASVHVVVKSTLSHEEMAMLKLQVREMFKAHGMNHLTVEVEFETEHCQYLHCC